MYSLTDWTIELHEHFGKDLDKLTKSDLEVLHRKRRKIKANPERQKHLAGGEHCYREPITKSVRLIYYVEGSRIWFLTIGRHDTAYEQYRKRLDSLRRTLE